MRRLDKSARCGKLRKLGNQIQSELLFKVKRVGMVVHERWRKQGDPHCMLDGRSNHHQEWLPRAGTFDRVKCQAAPARRTNTTAASFDSKLFQLTTCSIRAFAVINTSPEKNRMVIDAEEQKVVRLGRDSR